MALQKRTYSPEFRDEAVRMVIETSRPVAVVARELGLVEGTLGNWVNAYRKNTLWKIDRLKCTIVHG